MLEQSLRKLFEQQAEAQPPPAQITVADVLRQGRLRRRRHRIGAVGAPVFAAVAAAAIALTGAMPSGSLGHSGQETPGYGKLTGGAFDPSYLAINFGWLPKGTVATGGATSPGEEMLAAYSKRVDWTLHVYAPGACRAMTADGRFQCLPSVPPMEPLHSTMSIIGRGPVIAGHRSLWLQDSPHPPGYRPILAWEYAPHAWATVQQLFGPTGAATAARIARSAEFGEHIPFRFAARFTSLPRGWRIVGLNFGREGRLPAGVYLPWSYTLARLRTISPATRDNTPGELSIWTSPVIPDTTGCLFIAPRQEKYTRLVIHGYRFTLGDLLYGTHGHVRSNLELCDAHADGLSVNVSEIGVGAHPHLALTPTELVERLQLLGPKPSNWVTSPLPS